MFLCGGSNGNWLSFSDILVVSDILVSEEWSGLLPGSTPWIDLSIQSLALTTSPFQKKKYLLSIIETTLYYRLKLILPDLERCVKIIKFLNIILISDCFIQFLIPKAELSILVVWVAPRAATKRGKGTMAAMKPDVRTLYIVQVWRSQPYLGIRTFLC